VTFGIREHIVNVSGYAKAQLRQCPLKKIEKPSEIDENTSTMAPGAKSTLLPEELISPT
jgi:hypothetical protein